MQKLMMLMFLGVMLTSLILAPSFQNANAVIVVVTHKPIQKCTITGSKGWRCYLIPYVNQTPTPTPTPPCVNTKYIHSCDVSHIVIVKPSLTCFHTWAKGWICRR